MHQLLIKNRYFFGFDLEINPLYMQKIRFPDSFVKYWTADVKLYFIILSIQLSSGSQRNARITDFTVSLIFEEGMQIGFSYKL